MAATLNTAPRIEAPDLFYEEVLALERGRTPAEAHAVMAALVLVLANHIGDADVLREALDTVDRALPKSAAVPADTAPDFETGRDSSHFRAEIAITEAV